MVLVPDWRHDEVLRAHALMDTERFSAPHQVAQVAMMAGEDLDHLVQQIRLNNSIVTH